MDFIVSEFINLIREWKTVGKAWGLVKATIGRIPIG